VDFVPTREEQQALDELGAMIERRTLDEVHERDRASLIRAFRQTPRVNAIEVTCPNPFNHRLLRKVWEEYSMETYRSSQLHQGPRQLMDILSAAQTADLEVQHIRNDQLTSYFFTGEEDLITPDMYVYLSRLKSLSLTISDVPLELLPNNAAIIRLRKLISASPELENLHVKLESLFPVSLDFLPEIQPSPTKLRTLTLTGVSMDPVRFFSFLGMQVDTLKCLSIISAELVEGSGISWRDFLEEIRDKFACTLEKFQLAGVLKLADPGGETWYVYSAFNLMTSQEPSLSRALETCLGSSEASQLLKCISKAHTNLRIGSYSQSTKRTGQIQNIQCFPIAAGRKKLRTLC
jgi:hypothetical protein